MTRKAFVCGWPIEHSKSPVIHSFWLKEHGIDGSYEKIGVPPDQFAEFIDQLKSAGFAGGNITIPHKETALSLVDHVEEAASRIGAVNTIWFEDGKLTGDNTDWIGFLENLDQEAPGWRDNAANATALVLGAGGAARGILYALQQSGFGRIILANRTAEKALKLAKLFGAAVEPCSLEDVPRLMSRTDVLINTSSMGMKNAPEIPAEILQSMSDLKQTALVTDIVYVPLVTPLLAEAARLGLKTVDGLGMLLHQAVPGFEKWFGVRPKVTRQLRDTVLASMSDVLKPEEKRMIVLGLTGSIGMGKSTTAKMFRNEGIPVHDADASVHALYAGKAAPLIEAAFPGTTVDGIVDRTKLGPLVVGKPEAMKRLEAIIHPLVAEARDDFLRQARASGAEIAVLDIPLLFETGGERNCDLVAVVTTTPQEQRQRVLARPDMSEEKFEKILASQVPDKEKRARADFIIDTSNGLDAARETVKAIVEKIRARTRNNA